MRHAPIAVAAALVLVLWPNAVGAQQTPIPVRPLGPIVATSKLPLKSITQIRPLSDGRVLVNDPSDKQVVLFDSSLATFTPVADTTSGTRKAYDGAVGLLPFYGDSSLLADNASLAMVIIDPNGKLGRTIAAPRGDAAGLAYTYLPQYGAMFDGVGRVMSKWPARSGVVGLLSRGGAPTPVTPVGAPPAPDSQPIVRIDLATKKADTAAWLKAATNTFAVVPMPPASDGTARSSIVQTRNPMPTSDDWTVLSDGTVAVVREASYRIDWISPDGKHTTSPPIQHEWVHFTDSMKVAFMDSVKRVDSLARVAAAARRDSLAKSGATSSSMMGIGLSSTGVGIPTRYVDPSDLPDYFPPIAGVGNVKADADGNIWIKTYQPKPLPGGPVYDIVNRQAKLIDRVQIPGGTTLAGFGPGVVYLTSREGQGTTLARARIR